MGEENPYPEPARALEMIRDGLAGRTHFVETLFNPWNQAEKMSSPEEVKRLMAETPQALLDALEAIAKSEINHARRALALGASGVFLAIANAQDGVLTREEYARFSAPFDRMILDAVKDAPLNILHLHGDRVYLDAFYRGWPAAAISYSTHATGVPIAEVRSRFDGVLMGGLDEVNFRSLTPEQMKEQWQAAQDQAGRRFLLAPGCSVPDETADEELLRLVHLAGA
jgi:uroporphyrinogen decarboxylase